MISTYQERQNDKSPNKDRQRFDDNFGNGSTGLARKQPVPQPIVIGFVLPGFLLATVVGTIGVGWHWHWSVTTEPELDLPGIVECQEIRLSSKVGGRVEEVCVTEGSVVSRGQTLVRLGLPELTAQRSQLLATKAIVDAKLEMAENGPLAEQIESAQSQVDIAEARLAALMSGHRPEEISQAALDVKLRATEFAHARRELERLLPLVPSKAVSDSEYESSRLMREAAESRLEIARQRLRLLEAGTRVELIAEAKAQLRMAQAEFRLLEKGTRAEELKQLRGQRMEAEARIQLVEIQLAEREVNAPTDCHVEVIPIRKGDVVLPNQPVARVRVPDDLWIKAYIPETELGQIRLNQMVEISHDGTSKRHEGSIHFIASTSEFTPRNIQSLSERQHQVFAIKVQVKNASGVFKSGMAAKVHVKLQAFGIDR